MTKRIIARWHEREFFLAGQPLKLKLKALSHEEAPEFIKRMMGFIGEARKARDANNVGSLYDPFASLDPEFARACFEKWVRPAEQLEDEDHVAITTGLDVYGLANSGMALSVLTALQEYAVLTEKEGKAFSSPSTSGAGTGTTGAGSSPAISTGPEGGPTR